VNVNQTLIDRRVRLQQQLNKMYYLGKSTQLSSMSMRKRTILIKRLFRLGGIVGGGAALAYLFGTHRTYDIDFFFTSKAAFYKAVELTYDCAEVDVCFGSPYKIFDLAVVRCFVFENDYRISSEAWSALDTGICDIYPELSLNPIGTCRRMLIYHKRLGLFYKRNQVLKLRKLWNISDWMTNRLLKISLDLPDD